MAPPRSKEQIQADMDALLKKQQSGEIDLAKYSQDLGSLMQEMNLIIYKETTPPEPEYFEGQKFKELEVKDTLEDVAKQYGVEAEREAGESLPIEEAFARGKARVEKEVLPLRYKTGERVAYMEGLGISDVVDPIKGLIRDPKTGKVRKGTKFELLKEIPFRQRLMTKTQEQRVQERYEKSQRERGILESLGDLMVEEIVSEPIAEDTLFGNIYPDEMVTVVETPLATGLRAGLNTGSAVMAPMVQSINNMIGYFTQAPVSTRKEAGYEKTKIEGMGAQALTNALLGQGVGTQLAAQSFPPDERYDGVFNIATQGSWGNLLTVGASEMGVPITPFGEVLNIPGKSLAKLSKIARQNARRLSKTATGQRRIMAITNPVEAVRYSGIRSEIDEVLKAVDQGKTVADLEKEIVKKGGVLQDNTLRAKNAEFVGDIYASEKTAQEIIKGAKRTGKTEIRVEDVPQESPTLRAMFTEKESLPLNIFEAKTNRLINVLSETTGTGKNGASILRNMKNTADEVSNAILTGKGPIKNKSLINRAINTSKIMNYDMWALASGIVSKDLLPTVKEGKLLLSKSKYKPLTPEEIIKVGDAWKDLDNAKVWDKVDQSLFQEPKHIYQSTRNAVAEVAKDTMLRNFTDDLIYQSSTVAVPVKNLKTSTGRNTSAFNDYKFEMNQMLTSTIGKDLSHTLTEDSAKKLLQYERSSGLTISPRVKEKIQAGTPITKEEYNMLVDQVSGELAIDFLGGVRLQQGTLTAQRAQSLLESRQELIPAGRTVSTFKLGYKELANALRFTFKDTRIGDWFDVGTRLDQELPVMFQRFNQAMQDANSSAMSQVTERLTRGVRDKTVDPTRNFDENLAYYTNVSQDLEIETMGMSPRQDASLEISPTERVEFVGDVTEKTLQKSEKVAAQRQTQILADKYGRDNVNDYLKSQGIEPTYENIVSNIDDITQNIEVASRQMHQMKIWEDVIDDFFQAPSGSKDVAKISLRSRWQDNLRSLVRIDSGKPFWTEGNMIPLTLDNYRKMIAVLREKDGSLKKYGLAEVKLLPGREELYTLPLIKKMVEIQRTFNMNDTINQFIEQSPEMFLQLQRRQQTTLGLTATKQIADELVVNIQNTTARAIEKGLLSEDVLSAVIPRIREVLFDGMMADIWKNSSREVQKTFFDKYLRTLTETGKPVITDMNEFVLQMYKMGVLKSDTFQKVENQVQRILNDTQKIIKGIREGKPQDFKYNIKQGSKETSLAVDAGGPASVGRELTKTEAKIFQDLEEALPSVVDSMRNEYLNAITLRGGGVMDGLFSQQMNDLNAMMSSYGLSADTLVDNINRISPRFEYIGKQNVALIFGDMHADSMQKIIEISKSGKAQSILTELQKRAANLNAPSGSFQFWGAYMAEMFSVLRRGAIAQMLGGFILPAFRFFGMNSFSSPIIFATNLGAGEMKASTITKFSGLATIAPFITFPKTQVLGSRMKSNRYLLAPDEEIIISQAEGALKDYTAKELREIDTYYGIQNSMYDAELQSSQFNRLLIDIKATASGYKRTGLGKNVVDNLSPSGKNIWAEWSQAQDAQMRRFVFVDALKNGDSVPQAVEKARRSINDYGSLTPFERRYVAKSIWFYSFMRTMGTGVINSVYKAVLSGKTSPALKFLQIQDRLNRETLQDYESSTNAIKGRVFNIFTGTMDGVNMYAGGMMNPQMQMFDLMSNASIYMLFAAEKLTGQERRLEASLFNASMSFLAQMGKTGLQQSPLVGLGIEALEAEYGRGIPFPSELIYRAEAEGNLPELIKAYGLVERTPTSGRPLTRDGKYYDFPKDEAGIAMRRRYLMHRVLGLTSLNIISDAGDFWQGAQSRGLKEFYRASMFAESDPTITTPQGEEIPLETRTKYLKSLNKQQLEGYGNLWFSLYLSGLLTPLKDQPIKKNIDYGLRALENDLKKKRK